MEGESCGASRQREGTDGGKRRGRFVARGGGGRCFYTEGGL